MKKLNIYIEKVSRKDLFIFWMGLNEVIYYGEYLTCRHYEGTYLYDLPFFPKELIQKGVWLCGFLRGKKLNWELCGRTQMELDQSKYKKISYRELILILIKYKLR